MVSVGRLMGNAPCGPGEVLVNRSSPLGNPFKMGVDGKDERFRDAVCDAFDELLNGPMDADAGAIAREFGVPIDGRFGRPEMGAPRAAELRALASRVRGGESLRLMCHCHPRRCHAHSIGARLTALAASDEPLQPPHAASFPAHRAVAPADAASIATPSNGHHNLPLSDWEGPLDGGILDPSAMPATPLDPPTQFNLARAQLNPAHHPAALPPSHAPDATIDDAPASDAATSTFAVAAAAIATAAVPTDAASAAGSAAAAYASALAASLPTMHCLLHPPTGDGNVYSCTISPCSHYPAAFATRGKLANHVRDCHRPFDCIPAQSISIAGLGQCPHCSAVYATPGHAARHGATCPSRPNRAPTTSAAGASSPFPNDATVSDASATAGTTSTARVTTGAATPSDPAKATDYFTSNRAFFDSLLLDSLELHRVHSLALHIFPRDAVPAIDAPFRCFLRAAVLNLDDDAATAAIYALPRLLLAPPPSHLPRRALAQLLRTRTATLAGGGAASLWDGFDWAAATRVTVDFPLTSPELSAARMLSAYTHRSPSSVFRSMTDPPYLPPTPGSEAILLRLFPQDRNPDLEPDGLPAEALAMLPSSPGLGSAWVHDDTERARIVDSWRRHLRRNPPGAPDGTGLSGTLLTVCTDAFMYLALWLHSLLRSRITPRHRTLLATQTLGGKVKPDKQTGELPTCAKDTTAARPLARCPITRRLIAGFLARLLTRHRRQLYQQLFQYGLIPAGLEAAVRRHQLHRDLRPAPLASASLDLANAHTTVARIATYNVLSAQARRTGHTIDLLECMYFLSVYSAPSPTLIQVIGDYHRYYQTDALQQGEAGASHAFGHVLARLMANYLAPAVPSLVYTLIHDDTTFDAFPFHPPAPATSSTPASAAATSSAAPADPATDDGDPPPLSPDDPPDSTHATLTPLPHAIAVYADLLRIHLRMTLAGHKTVLSQPTLATTDHASIHRLLHLFPRQTRVANHLVLGGVPYGSDAGIAAALATAVRRYDDVLTRLIAIPAIPSQLRLLILLLSARPSSLFAHHLRALPPYYTTASSPAQLPYAQTLRSRLLAALSNILRVPPRALTTAEASTATHLQILLPSSLGGINLPDPTLLSHPAFLASFADTLPLLLDDHILQPTLIGTASWATSPSPTLVSASATFCAIAPLLAVSVDANPLHPGVRTRLTARDGSLALSLLHSVANRHAQHVFSFAVFHHLYERLLSATSALTPIARARLRGAAAPLTASLFTMYYVPAASSLTTPQLQFLVCHRLGIPLPFVRQTPPPAHCSPRCHLFPPTTPIQHGHDLYPTLPHLLHHIACGAGGYRTSRHDALVQLIAAVARDLAHANIDTSQRLCSSARNGTKVDIVISTPHIAPFVVAVDATVSCPLVPSYVSAASRDSSLIFESRAKEKNAKHLPGCQGMGRAFIPVVFTTFGGIGPPEARAWLDSLFSDMFATEVANGGTGQDTQHRRLLFYQSLQASLLRSTTTMAVQLSAHDPLGGDDDGDEPPPHDAPIRPTRSQSAPA